MDELRRVCQSLAMLDAIICPDWEYRYFSFNSKWDSGKMMASMRNGCGDELFILFAQHGAIIKGFWHESPLSPYGNRGKVWEGILTEAPQEFGEFLAEPAFSINDITFCIWWLKSQAQWQVGQVLLPEEIVREYEDPDGSEFLLGELDGNPLSYQKYAREYFEKEIALDAIKHIYSHKLLTGELIRILNPEISLNDLAADIDEIGYPLK
jgi:hypothetical protein